MCIRDRFNTIESITSPTPGTAAVPIEAKVAVKITVKIPPRPRSTPYNCAINTVIFTATLA